MANNQDNHTRVIVAIASCCAILVVSVALSVGAYFSGRSSTYEVSKTKVLTEHSADLAKRVEKAWSLNAKKSSTLSDTLSLLADRYEFALKAESFSTATYSVGKALADVNNKALLTAKHLSDLNDAHKSIEAVREQEVTLHVELRGRIDNLAKKQTRIQNRVAGLDKGAEQLLKQVAACRASWGKANEDLPLSLEEITDELLDYCERLDVAPTALKSIKED